ncbi:unnamed protein product [Rangifer tarandus platyrhynchus]|uniref:Uncharacterized protein n=3 Tax=Rangifer tarandus platyrhynchus TaxID=3082113 RepID=A0AC59ZYY1_RANTA|nr:unnamed protein product [Rangifer tarandus platyrhynchus]CAI9709358.1 unnamed protein product [Rangifer tarandus platyrhynchus]
MAGNLRPDTGLSKRDQVKHSMAPPRRTGDESSGCTICCAAEQISTSSQPEAACEGQAVEGTDLVSARPAGRDPPNTLRVSRLLRRPLDGQMVSLHLLRQPGDRRHPMKRKVWP